MRKPMPIEEKRMIILDMISNEGGTSKASPLEPIPPTAEVETSGIWKDVRTPIIIPTTSTRAKGVTIPSPRYILSDDLVSSLAPSLA